MRLGPIKIEALRLARADVRLAMKVQRIKISYVEASEITAAAMELVRRDPFYLKKARSIHARRMKSNG